ETHSEPNTENKWEHEWGYKAFFSSHKGNSRGVAILFNNTFSYDLQGIDTDNEGRIILLKLTINDQKIAIVNVYGPNTDDPVFYQLLKGKLESLDDMQLILGGDFNVVQDYTIDTSHITGKNNPKAQEAVLEMKHDLDLYDPWRTENPDKRMYTWHNSKNQQSRLDYFLISSDTMNVVDTALIKPGYRSDHSLIELHLNLSNHPKGPGFWKFNNSLLADEIFVKEIENTIEHTIEQYRDPNCVNTNPLLQEFTVNDQLMFEMIKLEVRGKTIAYSAAKKRNADKQEKELEKLINTLYENYNDNPTPENIERLNGAQTDLKLLREKKVDGIITRA
ncbi:MAG: endonuclease/exonuclease/phosphatase family protein, partial [Candidatus Omnitrophica bacterium]|nr:endonuclease/exonuclease/phosphatase family protein [Candidatus Omnitrophota bacterium]